MLCHIYVDKLIIIIIVARNLTMYVRQRVARSSFFYNSQCCSWLESGQNIAIISSYIGWIETPRSAKAKLVSFLFQLQLNVI